MRGRGQHIRGALTHAAIALLVGAILTGCGDDEEDTSLAELAPPDARLYAEAVLRPDSDQAEAIESVALQAAGIDDPGARLIAELDAALAGDGIGIAYADDIEPWLGERGAFFIRSFEEEAERGFPDFAALFEIEDSEAAQDFISRLAEIEPGAAQERAYGGFEYLHGANGGGYAIGIVEDAVVIATEPSFKVAVDAVEGESLGESEEFSERTDELGEDRLATLFLEPASAIEAAVSSGELSREDARVLGPLLASAGSVPLGASLDVDGESASVEVTTMVENEAAIAPDGELLGELPAGPAFAVALPHLGQTLEFAIDRLRTSGLPGAGSLREEIELRTGIDLSADLVGWLGDVSGFVSGSSAADFVVGLVAETADPDGPRSLLDAVRRLIEREEPSVPIGDAPEGAEYGFSIGIPGLGPQAGAGVFDDRLVGVLGAAPAEVLEPSDRLADDETFAAASGALGDDFDPLLFLDLPAVLPFLRAGGADEGRDYAEAEPYFDAFRFLIAGARVDDGLATVRFTVAVP